jgi:hypothetical protein
MFHRGVEAQVHTHAVIIAISCSAPSVQAEARDAGTHQLPGRTPNIVTSRPAHGVVG